MKEEGIYLITVVADLGNNIPLKYIFKEITYESNISPHNEDNNNDNDDKKVLIITLSVVIP